MNWAIKIYAQEAFSICLGQLCHSLSFSIKKQIASALDHSDHFVHALLFTGLMILQGLFRFGASPECPTGWTISIRPLQSRTNLWREKPLQSPCSRCLSKWFLLFRYLSSPRFVNSSFLWPLSVQWISRSDNSAAHVFAVIAADCTVPFIFLLC